MPLPNFIIIGAMKSATSTLHSNLQLHPEIGMSKFKEPSFFNLRFKFKDKNWYKSQFESGKAVNGESSPNYSKKHSFPGTAQRMHTMLPDVKLIYLTRDPINRITSHLHHNLYRDRFDKSKLLDVLKNDPNYILTSSYMFQLNEYLTYYNKSQFLFITTEELQSNLNGTLNKICDFLNVDNYNFEEKVISRNKSSEKFLIKKYDVVKRFLPRQLMKLYHLLFYYVNIKIERPNLDVKTIQFLKHSLKEDSEEFVKFTGIDGAKWKNV